MVAYLRGLLKPDYPNGYPSVVREELVLSAISKELDAEAKAQEIIIGSGLGSLVKNRKSHVDCIFKDLTDYRRLLELQETLEDEEQSHIARLTNDPDVNRLIDKLRKMQESGAYDKLREESQAKIKKYMNRPVQGFNPGSQTKISMEGRYGGS